MGVSDGLWDQIDVYMDAKAGQRSICAIPAVNVCVVEGMFLSWMASTRALYELVGVMGVRGSVVTCRYCAGSGGYGLIAGEKVN